MYRLMLSGLLVLFAVGAAPRPPQPDVHVGDCLLFQYHRDGVLDQIGNVAIHVLATGDYITHAAVVIDDHGKPMILESVSDAGVIKSPVQHRIAGYHGNVYRMRPKRLDKFQIKAMSKFGLRQIGKPYATGNYLPLKAPLSLVPRTYNLDSHWCSSLVASVYRSAGVVPERVNPAGTDPEDLLNWTHAPGRPITGRTFESPVLIKRYTDGNDATATKTRGRVLFE